jgi:hypothetical protein
MRALEPNLNGAHMNPGHLRQLRTRHPRLLAQPHNHLPQQRSPLGSKLSRINPIHAQIIQ